MEDEKKQIGNLQQGGNIEGVEAEEGGGRPRDEDAELVDEGVGWIEGAISIKWRGLDGE